MDDHSSDWTAARLSLDTQDFSENNVFDSKNSHYEQDAQHNLLVSSA